MSLNHTKRIKDPLLGHGLVSTEALEPGDRIIQIKDPYLIVVEKDALDRVCSYCLAENDISALKRCTGCKIRMSSSRQTSWTSTNTGTGAVSSTESSGEDGNVYKITVYHGNQRV
ncbi:hypothetical protein M7I_5298 [Glarea lozoyensis 74030]|uniref:Uncharacterized protein n=1 Tax=Glarea lozoyensis (strain ATCC 74030 / MF5533) TaxID=1104152 RepID=H0ERH9_GLAL7|nr:hypothetical protein M7I_5298 [Glarea lozoyensis 74030]